MTYNNSPLMGTSNSYPSPETPTPMLLLPHLIPHSGYLDLDFVNLSGGSTVGRFALGPCAVLRRLAAEGRRAAVR